MPVVAIGYAGRDETSVRKKNSILFLTALQRKGEDAMLTIVLLGALFVSEPRGQEYALEHGDPVLFWIPDEQPPRYGTCYYLWGYVPAIACDGKGHRFADVEWCRGGL